MSKHTDSQIVEYNEDGSWTTTTIETEYPMTRGQKAAAWGALGGIAVLPFVPVVAMVMLEKIEERREARRLAKQNENNN